MMKRVISFVLILALLLAAPPASVAENIIPSGEVHGCIYWNEALSVGYELDDNWAFDSEEALRDMNRSWQESGGHTQILMMARKENFIGNICVDIDLLTDDAYMQMSEKEYLKKTAPYLVGPYKEIGFEFSDIEIEPTLFLGEKHMCCRIRGEYRDPDDDTNAICVYCTVVLVKREGFFMGFTVNMIQDAEAENVNDALLARFFSEKRGVSAGVIEGSTYRNETLCLNATFGDGWEFAPDEQIVGLFGYHTDMTRQMVLDQLTDGGGIIDMLASNKEAGEMVQVTMEKLAEDCSELTYLLEIMEDTAAGYAQIYGWDDVIYPVLYMTNFAGESHPAFVISGPGSTPGSTIYITVIPMKQGNIMGNATITTSSEEAMNTIIGCFAHTESRQYWAPLSKTRQARHHACRQGSIFWWLLILTIQ